jgi:hypothetical protein
MLRLLTLAVFMSSDEVARARAFKLGYRRVCQHPREIGVLDGIKMLVIDFSQILFDDHELAIEIVNEAARSGIIVGIHTYYPEALKLQRLAKLPNVLVAKTHRRLLHNVGCYAKLRAHPRQKIARAAKILKGTVNDVHDYEGEGAAGDEASVPASV